LLDSSLIARPLASIRNVLVASPEFVKKNGLPKRPQDLQRYACLVFGAGTDRARWKLVRKADEVTVAVTAALVVNDFDILRGAAIDGHGVAFLPVSRCAESVRNHRLEVLLPAWRSPEIPFQAVYPSARLISPKVKTFVAHLQARVRSIFADEI
jgi:DNA-binding transcriptional LysR family regulator